MNWTTVSDLRAQTQKLWDKGALLAPLVQGEAMAPRRLRLVGPTSTELSERFDEVRAWVADLRQGSAALGARGYRIVLREFRHRVLGTNAVPDEVWLDTLDDALAVIGKQKDARRFASLVEMTRQQQSALLPWLEKRALNALALADVWPRLLAVVAWVQAHPRPGVYLRQVDLAGVDSKFIEANRGVLSELLDLALPRDAINASATGVSQFCRRFGFRDKPLRIRFRLLDVTLAAPLQGWLPQEPLSDPAHGGLPAVELTTQVDYDITLTQAAFAQLDLPLRHVFITENEVNFLAFPAVPHSLVVFGAGYGFDVLASAWWLHRCNVYYWGDLDTHGFAILDQLRAHLPHAHSLLMDRATLMAHAVHWGKEPQPLNRDLPRLNPDEAALFDDLRSHRLGANVRLEQERIGFDCVKRALAALSCTPLY